MGNGLTRKTRRSYDLSRFTGSPGNACPSWLSKANRKTIDLLISWSYWIPRKDRRAAIVSVLKDFNELQALGKGTWRIRIHILWQLFVAAMRSIRNKPST